MKSNIKLQFQLPRFCKVSHVELMFTTVPGDNARSHFLTFEQADHPLFGNKFRNIMVFLFSHAVDNNKNDKASRLQ